MLVSCYESIPSAVPAQTNPMAEQQRWRVTGARPNGARAMFSGADAEDYYDYAPSDEEEEEIASSGGAVASADEAKTLIPLITEELKSCSLLGPKTTGSGASGIKSENADDKISSESMQQYATRRSQLESALDAACNATSSRSDILMSGDAPFRFQSQSQADVSMSPAPFTAKVEGHAPEKKRNMQEQSEEAESDPLYDDAMDDADEKWVQSHIRGAGSKGTDASLCCPCCFVTVCMDCQRHMKYQTQYRALTALNCRIKQEEILRYTDESSIAIDNGGQLPFEKRLNAATQAAATRGNTMASRLQKDEFYPVVCSDCSTMVAVYDRDQNYYFFNVLPSNC